MCLRKTRKGRDSSPSSLLTRYNNHAPWRTTSSIQTNRDHNHFFHPETNPVIGHALVHSVDKTHVMVVSMKLIWLLFLNIFSFNFVPTPRKSLRFTRFRRSYVNHPVVVLTNHYQSYTAFLLDMRCSKWPRSFFCSCLFPMMVHLCYWAHLLFECC